MKFEYLLNNKVKVIKDNVHNDWIKSSGKLDHNDYHCNIIKKYLDKNKIAIDLGSHWGSMSAFYSKHSNHVMSFEMDPDNYSCLEHNMKDYNNITLYNVALSDKEKYYTINNVETNVGMNYLTTSKKKTPFKTKTLDIYNFPFIGYIKIDVELEEMNVLKGALNTIERWKPVLDIEINDNLIEYRKPGYTAQELIDFVCSLGYSVVHTIGKIGQRDLIFKTIN